MTTGTEAGPTGVMVGPASLPAVFGRRAIAFPVNAYSYNRCQGLCLNQRALLDKPAVAPSAPFI